LEAVELRVLRQPRLGRVPQPALLLGPDHLERVAEAPAQLLLHLAEDEPSPAPGDDVELVAAGPDVPRDDPVAAQAVEPGGTPLGARAPHDPPPVRASASSG